MVGCVTPENSCVLHCRLPGAPGCQAIWDVVGRVSELSEQFGQAHVCAYTHVHKYVGI